MCLHVWCIYQQETPVNVCMHCMYYACESYIMHTLCWACILYLSAALYLLISALYPINAKAPSINANLKEHGVRSHKSWSIILCMHAMNKHTYLHAVSSVSEAATTSSLWRWITTSIATIYTIATVICSQFVQYLLTSCRCLNWSNWLFVFLSRWSVSNIVSRLGFRSDKYWGTFKTTWLTVVL